MFLANQVQGATPLL